MEHEPATAARRLLARFVEGVFTGMLVAGVSAAIGGDLFDAETGSGRLVDVGSISGPLFLVLELVLLRRFGGTLPHLVFGMRALAADGERPSWWSAFVRTALYAGFPLTLVELAGIEHDLLTAAGVAWTLALGISVVMHPQHRGIHDRLAGTTVVRI